MKKNQLYHRHIKNAGLALVLTVAMLTTACSTGASPALAPVSASESTTSQSAPASDTKASAQDPQPAAESTGKTIAVIPKSLLFDYWQKYRIGAQQAGIDFGYNIEFQGTRTNTDLEGQIKLVEDFIQKNVSAICISPIDPDGMVPILQEAHDAGIPIIITDGRLNADFPYTTISTNDKEFGIYSAQKMLELMDDKSGEIAIISYVPGSVQESGREEGFREEMAKHSNVEIIGTYFGEGDRNRTYDITSDILTANPDITGFYSTNEGSSTGAILGLTEYCEQTNERKVCIALDPNEEVLKALEKGYISGCIAQNPYYIGYTGVENAVKVLNGEKIEKKIESPVVWVDAENMNDAEILNVLNPKEIQ